MRVWNITDHPETKCSARTTMIFGRSVAPGKYVTIEDDLLKGAHKLNKDAAARMVHIGNDLPADYVAAKGTTRATPRAGKLAHGEPVETKVVDSALAEEKVHEDAPFNGPKKKYK